MTDVADERRPAYGEGGYEVSLWGDPPADPSVPVACGPRHCWFDGNVYRTDRPDEVTTTHRVYFDAELGHRVRRGGRDQWIPWRTAEQRAQRAARGGETRSQDAVARLSTQGAKRMQIVARAERAAPMDLAATVPDVADTIVRQMAAIAGDGEADMVLRKNATEIAIGWTKVRGAYKASEQLERGNAIEATATEADTREALRLANRDRNKLIANQMLQRAQSVPS